MTYKKFKFKILWGHPIIRIVHKIFGCLVWPSQGPVGLLVKNVKDPQGLKNGPQALVDPPQGSTRHCEPPTRTHKALWVFWYFLLKGPQGFRTGPQGLTMLLRGHKTTQG